MAWQLHYTSVRSGPTGRAGFQFVAETPGLPPGLRAQIARFMVYRPPPHAPPAPGREELAGFPVAFGYDRLGARPVLVRCRYLGRDYSRRYGNFFAHVIVTEPEEMEGLRPAELWRAPLWWDTPRDRTLPSLGELAPGEACDPESLADWLADRWDAASSYDLLGRLIEIVIAVLGRGHGRVVLVAGDTESIARWIAVVSYSLPLPVCTRMSFITYSADPGVAPQRVVGTTPDVWQSTRHDGPAVFLDSPSIVETGGIRPGEAMQSNDATRLGTTAPSRAGESRYAQAAVACWRDLDFTALDAMGELADAALRAAPDVGADLSRILDQAAALLALCQGDANVTPREEAGAAELMARYGGRMPEWVWRDLAPALPSMGFEPALTILTWARRRGDADLANRCAARCAVLALGNPSLRARLPELQLPGPALARLAPLVGAALGTAPDLTEVARIACLAEHVGMRTDGDAGLAARVKAAAAACARRGAADLPAAVRTAPAMLRDPLLAGALAGLKSACPAVQAAVLTDPSCDLLYDRIRRVQSPPGGEGDPARRRPGAGLPPAVALHVLRSVGRRRPDRRLEVTHALIELGEPAPETPVAETPVPETPVAETPVAEIEETLRAVWMRPPPTVGECNALLGSLGSAVSRFVALQDLPSHAFVRLAQSSAGGGNRDGDDLAAAKTVRLARLVAQVLPAGCRAVADAAVIVAYAAALQAATATAAAGRLNEIADSTPKASRQLVTGVFDCAAQRLALRPPAFRVALLAAVTQATRSHLIRRWTGGPHSRAARNELMEVALRLHGLGVADPRLEEWAAGLAARRLAYVQLDAYFREHGDLRARLKQLAAHSRRRRREG